ncbi:MAG TPA: hypothetical protein VFF74_04535 [Methylophilaceae bacterium]|nr:hypothetical protein [Methylophilaceae bacterium]
MNIHSEDLFDPDMPTASAVLASLCCVTVRYANRPCPELAKLAAALSRKLTAPQYAESQLITEVAKRLVLEWETILIERNIQSASGHSSSSALH